MSLHPLLLAVLALHAAGLLLLAGASVTAVRMLAGRDPGAASAQRARRERSWATASLLGRVAACVLAAAALAFVAAVAGTVSMLVPKAMCGEGVLQAMGGEGGKALALQGLALLALAAWSVLERLDRSSPDSPLTPACARVLLLTLAAQGADSLGVLRAVLALDPQRKVDCCSLVYGRAASAQGGGFRLEGAALLALAIGLAAAVLALAALARSRSSAKAALGLAAAVLAFVPMAALALVRVLAAYRYEMVRECPWCLFLPQHGYVGYALFGALAFAALEAVAAAAAVAAARASPALDPASRARVRSAALRIALAVGAFALLAAWPAVAWRLRNGAWLG